MLLGFLTKTPRLQVLFIRYVSAGLLRIPGTLQVAEATTSRREYLVASSEPIRAPHTDEEARRRLRARYRRGGKPQRKNIIRQEAKTQYCDVPTSSSVEMRPSLFAFRLQPHIITGRSRRSSSQASALRVSRRTRFLAKD